MIDRKAINFYRSYYEVAKMLPVKYRWAFVEAVLDYQFTGKEPSDTTGFELAWVSQKHSLDKQLQGFKHGQKGGRPPKGTSNPPPKGTSNQEQEKVQVQVQLEKKVLKKTIEERKVDFWQNLTLLVDQYDINLLKDFYEYWCEYSPGAKKMRWEKEKAFSLKRRLGTWVKNEQRFGSQKKLTKLQKDHNFLRDF